MIIQLNSLLTHPLYFTCPCSECAEAKPVARRNQVCGEIKLSLQYHRGALTVMVCPRLRCIPFYRPEIRRVSFVRSFPGASCALVIGDGEWPRAEYVRKDVSEAGPLEGDEAQDEGGAPQLLSQFHGDGE